MRLLLWSQTTCGYFCYDDYMKTSVLCKICISQVYSIFLSKHSLLFGCKLLPASGWKWIMLESLVHTIILQTIIKVVGISIGIFI